MKIIKTLFILLFSLFLVGCSQLKDGDYNIEIYATNDIHGYYFDSLYVGDMANRYSLANVSHYINERRAERGEDNVVFLDLGDNFQGDNAAYYFNEVERTEPLFFTKVVNYLKYDALVVGNHDVEAGHHIYDQVVKELNIPYMGANAINEKTKKPYFQPYTIIKRNGVKIAVIGMTNPFIPKWLNKELWSGISFEPISDIVQDLVDRVVEKESPHITILAIHAGVGSDDPDENNPENPGRFLAHRIKGVDIIMCAHEHRRVLEYVPNGSETVLLTEGGSRASHLASVSVELKVERGEVTKKSVKGELISMSGIPKDENYLNSFRDDYLKVKSYTNREIGLLDRDIIFNKSASGVSDYMNILHTVNLHSIESDISFAAPLNISGEVSKGVIRVYDLSKLYPFENQLYVVTMTGLEVKNYLEYSYDNWINRSSASFNWDSAAGLKYKVHRSAPKGERVEIVSMADGSDFILDKIYRVSTTSYRASGGGDLFEVGAGIDKQELEKRIVERYPDIRDLLHNYIIENRGLEMDKISNWQKLGYWEFK